MPDFTLNNNNTYKANVNYCILRLIYTYINIFDSNEK